MSLNGPFSVNHSMILWVRVRLPLLGTGWFRHLLKGEVSSMSRPKSWWPGSSSVILVAHYQVTPSLTMWSNITSSGCLSKVENYSDFFFWIGFFTEPIHHLPDTRKKEQECTAGGGGGICHTTDLDQLKMLLNCTLEDDSQPSFSI